MYSVRGGRLSLIVHRNNNLINHKKWITRENNGYNLGH